MDILKKTLSAPTQCNITDTHVSIGTHSAPRDMPVPLPLTRDYTIDQLCFYIVNSDLAYTEYLKKCRSVGILQVSYVDQKKLIEEITKHKSVSAVTSFDPAERHRREEDYAFVDKYFRRRRGCKIVVPDSYQSLLNLQNAKEFLESGVFRRTGASFAESTDVPVADRFSAVQDCIGDWVDVVAVFLDGTRQQYRDWKWRSLKDLVNHVPAFFLYARDGEEKKFEGLDVMSIKVPEEGRLDTHVFDMMWKRINAGIGQPDQS